MKVSIAHYSDVGSISALLNHQSIAPHLGGFTMTETIRQKIKNNACSMWIAEEDSILKGAMMMGGRAQAQEAKMGEVGVKTDFRRKRIGTSLYTACIAQTVLEGRRLWLDTIVGNNPTQFYVLPTLGFEIWGTLKHKTASFLDIVEFGLELSPLTLDALVSRLPSNLEYIEVEESFYTHDLLAKNLAILRQKRASFVQVVESAREYVLSSKVFRVVQGPQIFTNKSWRTGLRGAVAQLGEHLSDEEIDGSSPLSSTTLATDAGTQKAFEGM